MANRSRSVPNASVTVAKAAAVAVCFMAVVYGFQVISGLFTQADNDFSIVSYLVVVPLCFAAYKKMRHESAYDGLPCWPASLGVALALSVLSAAISAFSENVHVAEPTLLSVLCIGLAAPVAEEFIFRGIICSMLSADLSKTAALIVSTALFAAAHFDSENAIALPLAVLAGLLFGVLFQRSGSILDAIVAHSGANLLAFLWLCAFR